MNCLDQNTQREIKIDGEMTRAYDFGILGGLGVMGLTIAFFHGTSGSSLGQLNFYIFDSFLQGVAEGGRLKGNAELAEYVWEKLRQRLGDCQTLMAEDLKTEGILKT